MNMEENKRIIQEAYIEFCLADNRAEKIKDRYDKIVRYMGTGDNNKLFQEWIEEAKAEVVKLSIQEGFM